MLLTTWSSSAGALGAEPVRGAVEVMAIVRTFYALAIAAFLIMLVAFGISAFYQAPQYDYDRGWEANEEALRHYEQNVFIISYPCGLFFVLLGLLPRHRPDFVMPGLILGGIGVLFYAISQQYIPTEYRFAGAAIGLVVLVIVGYRTVLGGTAAHEG